MPFAPQPALASGVSFFFVLSGFILAYNYDGRDYSIRRFYLARFARIWPLHVATLALAMFMLPQLGDWAAKDGMSILAANLFLLQSWVPSPAYALSFNNVSWSISTEMFFYAVFPFALMVKRIWLLALIAAVVTVAIAAYGNSQGVETKTGPWDWSWTHFILHFPPMRLFEFLTGMAAERLFARKRYGGDLQEVAAVAAVMASVVAMAWWNPPGPLGVWASQGGSFLAFAFMVYTFAVGRGFVSRALQHPGLVLLGEISFATYMVHQIVIRHAVQSKLTAIWSTPVAAAAVILVVYLTSYVLWWMVEKPAQQWLLRLRVASIVPRLALQAQSAEGVPRQGCVPPSD